MRCLSCNKILNKFERTSKYVESGEYLDLCGKCLEASDIPDGIIVDNYAMYNRKESE